MKVPPRISVVIPVINAEKYMRPLLGALSAQEPVQPHEVILIDSMSTDGTRRIAETFSFSRILPIESFSHGAARNAGARASRGDIVVFLSQDALPADESWLTRLILPFGDSKVGAAYSRQIPYADANPMERFFLSTRFPGGDPVVREAVNGSEPALQDVFFSNVSSAARREVLDMHPFDEELIMSEDQKFSLDLLRAGLKVVYQPTSVVYHSHNYTLKTVFQRYFDSVYSLTQIFQDHNVGSTLSMGSSYSRMEFVHMISKHRRWLPYYALYFAAKTGGTLTGHIAHMLPNSLREKFSLHSYHWERFNDRP